DAALGVLSEDPELSAEALEARAAGVAGAVPKPGVGEHPLPWVKSFDLRSDGRNGPGRVGAEDVRSFDGDTGDPGEDDPVGSVEGGGGDPDRALSWPGRGGGNVEELEAVGAAVIAEPEPSHPERPGSRDQVDRSAPSSTRIPAAASSLRIRSASAKS